MTLATLLVDAARRSPERPALVADSETTTYAELDELAARAAGALRELGVTVGAPVAFLLPNTVAGVAAFHGALRLGAVPVPLNPLLSAHEIDERVADAEARLVDVDRLAGGTEHAVAPPHPGDVAVVLYTSGTTGNAKRVELTHGGLRLSADATAVALGLREDDVVLGAVPLAHVFGMTGCMNAVLAAGGCVSLVRRFHGESALETIECSGVTVFMGVPAMCTALLGASAETGAAPVLRLAHVGGAPLARDILRAFEDRFGARVLEGYGMTEAGGAVTIARADEQPSIGSVGTPLAGDLRLAADGEVLVRSPTLARGLGDWFPTGDIGRIESDGSLTLLDRKKDIILRGGYSVYPSEVESALAAHPGVREVVVLGVPHPTLGEEVAAVVVPGSGCDAAALRDFARQRLAAYKYPRVIELVDALPHGPTGKVDRRALDRHALARRLDPDASS